MTPHTPYSYPDYDYKSIIRINQSIIIKNKCVECVDYNLAFIFNKNFNTLPLISGVLRVCCCVYSLNGDRFTPLPKFRAPRCAVNGPNKTFKIHFNSCLKSSRRNVFFYFLHPTKLGKHIICEVVVNNIKLNQVRLIILKTIYNLAHLEESRMA